jgi:HEAT repeat protein
MSFYLICLLLPAPGDCSPHDARLITLTPEGRRLLNVATDPLRSSKDRVAAVDALGERREAGAVPRLLRLLPGTGDLLTHRVIIALGQIGDRRALPTLIDLRDNPPFRRPGKTNVALDNAIDALKQK